MARQRFQKELLADNSHSRIEAISTLEDIDRVRDNSSLFLRGFHLPWAALSMLLVESPDPP